MEILGELLLILLQLLGEILLQLLAEILLHLGVEAIREVVRPSRPQLPWLAAIGYALLGALFAYVSLWPFPHSFAHHVWLRLANLVITPGVAGLVMVALGRRRARPPHEAEPDWHRFGYGFLFALTFTLIRFIFTRQ